MTLTHTHTHKMASFGQNNLEEYIAYGRLSRILKNERHFQPHPQGDSSVCHYFKSILSVTQDTTNHQHISDHQTGITVHVQQVQSLSQSKDAYCYYFA